MKSVQPYPSNNSGVVNPTAQGLGFHIGNPRFQIKWAEKTKRFYTQVGADRSEHFDFERFRIINGFYRFCEGRPTEWSRTVGLSMPTSAPEDIIQAALIHTSEGNTDSVSHSRMVPLWGRQWVEGTPDSIGTWQNSSARPFATFTADGSDGFTANDTNTGGDDDRSGSSIGSNTASEPVRIRFDYDTTGSSGSTGWKVQLRSAVDGTLFAEQTFASGASSGTFEGVLTSGTTDASTYLCIQQTSGAATPSTITISGVKVWKNWISNWTASAIIAPDHDAIKGGQFVLNSGAPRTGAYAGSSDEAGIQAVDGISFPDATGLWFGISTSTNYSANHQATLAMGAGSSVDSNDDPDGFLIKRNGGSDNFLLLRDGEISASRVRQTANGVSTDVQAFLKGGSASVRHDGASVSDTYSPSDMDPNILIIGGRYLSGAIQNEQAITPNGFCLTKDQPSTADSDLILSAIQTTATALNAL